MQDPAELVEWLESAAPRVKSKGMLTVILRAYNPEEGHPQVQDFEFERDANFEEVAEAILQVARRDFAGVGEGRYTVHIEGLEKRRYSLSLDEGETPDKGYQEGTQDFSDPNMRSAWGLQLEHNQKIVQALLEERKDVSQLQKSSLKEAHDTIRTMSKERHETVRAYAELVDQKHLRDLEIRRVEKSDERRDEAFKLAGPVLRSIATRMLGPGTLPQEHPVLQQILSTFASLRPEQLQEMIQTGTLKLDKTQMITLLDLFGALKDMAPKAEPEGEAHAAQ